MEQPLFFPNGEYNLFSVHHAPEAGSGAASTPVAGVVLIHPFAEEKLACHRTMVDLARRLCGEGIHCLRFDFMGQGDSDGRFEDSTVETMVSDIRCAASRLRERGPVEKVGLVGIRLGAALAAMAAEGMDVDFLVAIAPVVDGKSYMDQCLRSNLTTQMAMYREVRRDRQRLVEDLMRDIPVNVDGYNLTKTLYLGIGAMDPVKAPPRPAPRSLVVDVVRSGKAAGSKDASALRGALERAGGAVEAVAVEEEPFWKDSMKYTPDRPNLERAVVDWISERARAIR